MTADDLTEHCMNRKQLCDLPKLPMNWNVQTCVGIMQDPAPGWQSLMPRHFSASIVCNAQHVVGSQKRVVKEQHTQPETREAHV